MKRGLGIAVGASLAFGTSGAFIKPLFEAGWSPAAAVAFRTLIAAALLTPFALLSLRPAIWFDGPVSQLEELYVVPALRSGGIGTQVLARCRRIVQDLGSPEMHINVDEVDVDTRRFYERHGFVNIEDGVDYRMLCYIGPTEAPTS